MNRLFICVLVLLFSMAVGACTEEASEPTDDEATAQAAQAEKLCIAVRGAWEFETGDRKGMAITGDTHFLMLMADKDRGTFADETPTEAEKAAAYSSMFVGVFEDNCVDSESHYKVLYHTDPTAVGATGISDFEIDGDELRWWVLDEAGNRPDSPPNVAHRMKSEHGGACAPLAGTWAFTTEGTEGIWVATESYGIELQVQAGREASGDQPSTPAEQARAYDTVTWAGAWSQTCDGPGRGTYRNLYAFNPARQGENLRFDYTIEDDILTWWNYPEGGEPGEKPTGTGRRIN